MVEPGWLVTGATALILYDTPIDDMPSQCCGALRFGGLGIVVAVGQRGGDVLVLCQSGLGWTRTMNVKVLR